MLNFIIAILAGLVCGVLSGFGIGGGSLLMVWMTAVLSMEQKAAQSKRSPSGKPEGLLFCPKVCWFTLWSPAIKMRIAFRLRFCRSACVGIQAGGCGIMTS